MFSLHFQLGFVGDDDRGNIHISKKPLINNSFFV